MVYCLFQNYCMTHGPKKQKLTRFTSLLLKNRYALQTKIEPIFNSQKLTRFLMDKNQPDF